MELDEPRGVLVVGVEPGSLAARAGLRPQDVILSVNGENVKGVRSLGRAVSGDALDNGVRMLVKTEGATRFVFLNRS